MRYLWPDARAVALDSVGYPAAAVVFPRHVKDAPVTLTRLDAARALALLGEGGSVFPTIVWLQHLDTASRTRQ